MHLLHALEGLDLRLKDDRIIGFGEEVIAAGCQAADQCVSLGEAGQKDDRNEVFAGRPLDLPRRLEAIHDRHQRIEQNQIGTLRDKALHGLLTVLCRQDPMPEAFHQTPEDHPISGVVVGDQYRQARCRRDRPLRLFAHVYSIANSCSKLDIAKTLRTSGLQ